MQYTKKIKDIGFPNIEVTYFEDCYTSFAQRMFIENALYNIKSGTSKALIDHIRNGHKDFIKRLPCISFSALLSDSETVSKPSGLACLFFDKVKDLSSTKKTLSESKYIMAFWVSPFGDGIHALVKIPTTMSEEEYRSHYNDILKHFRHLKPNMKTKEINQLCFESYDPNLYLNLQAFTFNKTKKINITSKDDTNKIAL